MSFSYVLTRCACKFILGHASSLLRKYLVASSDGVVRLLAHMLTDVVFADRSSSRTNAEASGCDLTRAEPTPGGFAMWRATFLPGLQDRLQWNCPRRLRGQGNSADVRRSSYFIEYVL